MTTKQTEIAKMMENGYTLSFHKHNGGVYVLSRDRSGNKVHKTIANAMVLQGIVVPTGGDANWNDYKLSDKTVRQIRNIEQVEDKLSLLK